MTVLCLGEAIVDLLCERPVASLDEVDAFAPHPGGALANVAVAARRAGADAALAGGVGDDPWGRWLRQGLESARVDMRWFSLVEGPRTPVALVTVDARGEPAFQIYGEGIEAAVRSLSGRIEQAVDAASALVLGSNTLVGEPERELTLRARELALERGIPMLFDPNLRAPRWDDLELARDLCRELCAGAFLVRANREESRWLSGEDDPDRAAEGLCELGARLGVVTRGADGAVLRGEDRADVPGVGVDVRSTVGAGDALTGALAAGLAARDWRADRAGEALPRAVEASAEACTHWGAQS